MIVDENCDTMVVLEEFLSSDLTCSSRTSKCDYVARMQNHGAIKHTHTQTNDCESIKVHHQIKLPQKTNRLGGGISS